MGTEARKSTSRGSRPGVVPWVAAWALVGLLCLWPEAGFVETAWAQLGFSPASWRAQGPFTAPVRIVSLALDPRTDSTIYYAAPGGGIWKSNDGGQGWAPLLDSAISLQVCSVAVDPISPDVLYAGTGDDRSPRPAQGVARSTDSGRSWNFGVRFTNQPVCTLAVDPLANTRVFASSSEGLFLSNDSGASWRKVLPLRVTEVAFDGRGTIYAGVLAPDSSGLRQNLLARSSDGGQNWMNLPLPVPAGGGGQTTWVSLVARGESLFVVLAYQSGASSAALLDFYWSADGGGTWTLVPTIGTTGGRVQLLADAEATNFYLAGQTLLRSQNQGNTWTSITTVTQQFNSARFTGGSLLLAGEKGLELVALTPGAPAGVIASSAGQYLAVSADTLNNPWAGGPAGLFGVIPPNPDWKAAVTTAAIGGVVAAASGPANIFAAGNSLIFRSTNGGATFSSTTVLGGGELRAPFPPLALDPVNPAIVFTAGSRVYRTSDSGATWVGLGTVDTEPGRVVTALTMAPFARQIMYAATACLSDVTPSLSCPNNSTIGRSQNSGQSWTRIATLPGLVNRLAVDPRQAFTVYAAAGAFPGGPSTTAGYGTGDLLRSADGGINWISIRANLPQVPINTVAVDPSSSPSFFLPAQTLYVGTDAGVFVSFNAGVQWTAINSDLPATPVTDLSLRQPAGTLRAATFGRGVYQTSVTGLAASLIISPLSVNVTLVQGGTAVVGVSLANVSAARQDWQLTALDPWLSATRASGQVDARSSSQVLFQVSAAGLQLGTYRGRLRVTTAALGVIGNNQDILVELRVTTAPARIVMVSGNNASGGVGSTLPPLTVQVLDADGSPVAAVPVTFAITSGGGSLSARTASSDASGRASTLLTLPATPGAIQVVAAAGSVSITFTVTAVQTIQPALQTGAAVNGATFNSAAPVAPGSIVSIFGRNLAEASAAATAFPLPMLLAKTRVLLGPPSAEVALHLFYISPEQVNVLLPYELTPGIHLLTVENASARGNAIEIVVTPQAPGIFTLNSSGRGPGVFLKPDGSVVMVSNPARRGSVVTLYATGLGAVDPPLATGAAAASAEPFNRTVLAPIVRLDNQDAEVLYSGLAPGFAGLYQVNVRIPSVVSAATNVPLSLTIGGATSNTVTIPVQ